MMGLLASTIAASLVLDNGLVTLPYFPIEISRMLATGPWASRVFLTYVALFTAYCGASNPWHLSMGLLVLGVGLFDDVHHRAIHMGCVYALIVLVAWRVWLLSPDKLGVVGCAILLYACRIAMKIIAVWVQDRADLPDGMVAFHDRVLQLMMDGKGATPETMIMLMVGGLLQWTSFGMMCAVIPAAWTI
jgi:hypothetical protein